MLNIQSMNPSASSNARGKIHGLRSLVVEESKKNHCLPFIAIAETWLKSYIHDAQIKIPNYNVKRSDRDKRRGGGVLLYYHVDIPLSSFTKFDDGTCEVVFCCFDTKKTSVAVVYRPPNAPFSSFKNAMNFIENAIQDIGDDSYQHCVTGDFNFPLIDWSTGVTKSGGTTEDANSSNLLLKFMADHLMNQYILTSTRENSILELFFCNSGSLVTNVTPDKTSLSDHGLVDIMLSYNPSDCGKQKKPARNFDTHSFRSLDFRKGNFQSLKDELKAVDWHKLRSLCTFEEFPGVFTETLLNICKNHIPVKKRGTGRPHALNSLRRKKKRLKARYQAIERFGNPAHAKQLKTKLALVCYDIKEAINKDLDHKEAKAIEKIRSNPKFFYSYAKQFRHSKSVISMLMDKNKHVVTDQKKMADLLQDQFTSVFSDPNSPDISPPDFAPSNITSPFQEADFDFPDEDIISAAGEIKADSTCGPDGIPAILLKTCIAELCMPFRIIWSESISSGIVPAFYKLSYVTPLYKKGNRVIASNYRPVSLTSHVVKIYERILRKVIVSFLEKNSILCHNQHGFRSGRSCLTQMLSHFDDILEGLTNKVDTDAIYLDYAKAFDKVDHQLLLAKLKLYGFPDQLLNWVCSFLTGRTQNVVLDGVHSYVSMIISGVPQGTVLGPILFILFINDMESCVKHSKIRFFADDTRISKQITCEADVPLLQEDLDSVIAWSHRNNMMLHEDKFEFIIHPHQPNSPLAQLPFVNEHMIYQISSGDTLYPVQELTDLGITVCSDLTWSTHINSIANRAKTVSSWVLSVFKTRDKSTMCTVYKSLVRSHLEYCCPLWNPTKLSDIRLLEEVQRTFTSKISGMQHLDYWTRLKRLGLMSLQRRRERYIIIQMWKILNLKAPNDVAIQFTTPNRRGIQAKIPPINRNSSLRNQTRYDKSFSVLGPRLWNILPSEITLIVDSLVFKSKLTKYFLSFPDEPPVTGYCCSNDNSIIEWHGSNAEILRGRSANLMAL